MRKSILGFMVMLMLTPVLACAMTFCPLQAAQAAQAKQQMPCHEKQENSGPMLVLDCMGVDLFATGFHADVPQPDHPVAVIAYNWVDISTGDAFLPAKYLTIRGPPEMYKAQGAPPVLLTTQRIRI